MPTRPFYERIRPRLSDKTSHANKQTGRIWGGEGWWFVVTFWDMDGEVIGQLKEG